MELLKIYLDASKSFPSLVAKQNNDFEFEWAGPEKKEQGNDTIPFISLQTQSKKISSRASKKPLKNLQYRPQIFSDQQDAGPLSKLRKNHSEEPLNENIWGFGYFAWLRIKEEFRTIERLYAAIHEIQNNIQKIKEQYRDQAIRLDLQVELNQEPGISGSYFLIDNEGNRKYLIKPLDEEAGCIHNAKYFSPFTTNPFRNHIPLYFSSMRETLAYQIACMIEVDSIIPKTQLGILESDSFHHFGDSLFGKEKGRFEEICGALDKEKLCSIQEYVTNSKSLFEALHDFQMLHLSDDEIASRLDQKDFEQISILLWTTYDTDAHLGNILVYPKGVDEIGNEILGLKKIDNGLAFPDKNEGARNHLALLPNAKQELSEEARAKIAAIDVNQLTRSFERMGLESASAAMGERISILKELVNKRGITIQEINGHLSKIGKKE